MITGAASGIGRSIALRLADDGFDVALNDLDSSKGQLETLTQEISQKGRQVVIVLGDVSQETDVKRMVNSVVHDLGGLDVVSGSKYFHQTQHNSLIHTRWSLTLEFVAKLSLFKTVGSLRHGIYQHSRSFSGRRGLGSDLQYKCSRSFPVLQVCGTADDQTRSGWANHWCLLDCGKTR